MTGLELLALYAGLAQIPATAAWFAFGGKKLWDWLRKDPNDTKAQVAKITLESIKLFKVYHSILPTLVFYTQELKKLGAPLVGGSGARLLSDRSATERIQQAVTALQASNPRRRSFGDEVASLRRDGFLPLLDQISRLLELSAQLDGIAQEAISTLKNAVLDSPPPFAAQASALKHLKAKLVSLPFTSHAYEDPDSENVRAAAIDFLRGLAAFCVPALQLSVVVLFAYRYHDLGQAAMPRLPMSDADTDALQLHTNYLDRGHAEVVVSHANKLILQSLGIYYSLMALIAGEKG